MAVDAFSEGGRKNVAMDERGRERRTMDFLGCVRTSNRPFLVDSTPLSDRGIPLTSFNARRHRRSPENIRTVDSYNTWDQYTWFCTWTKRQSFSPFRLPFPLSSLFEHISKFSVKTRRGNIAFDTLSFREKKRFPVYLKTVLSFLFMIYRLYLSKVRRRERKR